MHELLTIENAIAVVTLTAMEIVLGIDNIVFITILTGKLPAAQRPKVRNLGILAAVVTRIGLLLSIKWVMGLTATLFNLSGRAITGQGLILLGGGLFLLAKATYEIHHRVEGDTDQPKSGGAASAGLIIGQIMLLDIVFSLDSVITAVGMVKQVEIMIAAILISATVMIAFAGPVGRFVERHPAIKMLALAFLLLIGVMLVAEGLGRHVPKGYIYFAMAFSLGVEVLNIRAGTRRGPAASGS